MVVLANVEEDISIIEVDVECSTRSRPQGASTCSSGER